MTLRLTEIEPAAEMLRKGQLVAFATETVYGLGANALDAQAVAKVFEAKQRPHFDPLIVHLASSEEIDKFVLSMPDLAKLLAEKFWPGPLTLVLPKRDVIPDLVTAGLPNVAIRVPAHEMARQLIAAAGVPVAAPSANPFGAVSPTTAQHVLDGLDGRIDAVLDGGSCQIGLESTVIQCGVDGSVKLLRPGGLPVEEIEVLVGQVQRVTSTSQPEEAPQAGPGMLRRHYAPRIPLQLVDDLESVEHSERAAALVIGREPEIRFQCVENLSPSRNLVEAAANFFASLRRLEDSDVERIYAKLLPAEGLGIALNDRLYRASVAE